MYYFSLPLPWPEAPNPKKKIRPNPEVCTASHLSFVIAKPHHDCLTVQAFTTIHHPLKNNRSIAFVNYLRQLLHPIHLHLKILFSIDIGRRKPHDSPHVLCVSVYPRVSTTCVPARGPICYLPLTGTSALLFWLRTCAFTILRPKEEIDCPNGSLMLFSE